jgi:hypothetical protein
VKVLAGLSGTRGWKGYRAHRWLFWCGALAIVIAGGAALMFLGPNKDAPPEVFTDAPVTQEPVLKKVALSQEAREVAGRFILTAVARKHLEEGWRLSGPNLRGGLSREEWLTGNNPVVPFPVDALAYAPMKIDESFETSALIEVALLPKKNSGVRSQLFFLALEKVGKGKNAHWVVNNWVPRSSAVIPR